MVKAADNGSLLNEKKKRDRERERKRERERVKKQRVILPNGLAGRVLFCAEATGVKKKMDDR